MAIDQDAYCTLVMSDNYLPGAAVLAHSLRDAGTDKKLAVMVTPNTLRDTTITELKSLYDYVLPVNLIANPDPSNLYLMDRSDLLYAFTKINLWRLTQFRKIVYIDADVVALRAPDELFDLAAPFAASPDVGWPDAFNSGVMALTPHMGTFWALHTLASSGDSFDGADQGLLNQYYEHKDWHRLSFTYNCTPSANYQYEPAYRYHKSKLSMIHFIGNAKPWMKGRSTKAPPGGYNELLSKWWAVYDRHYKDSPASTIVQSLVAGEPVTGLTQAKVEPAPAVEAKPFSAPHMAWDAEHAPPPAESKPEAANFPTQQYEFTSDKKLFQPPGAYPEPPKDMWYEVPTEKSAPQPVFPWEGRDDARPTRVFAEDQQPVNLMPTLPSTSATDSSPVAPTIRVTSDEPWDHFQNRNAWDSVAGIDQYVRSLTSHQKNREKREGKVQVISQTEHQIFSPVGLENEGPQAGRRESLILTDFPSAIDRPSLPVTPAPLRRPSFWGEDRNETGTLPPAEGVPHQTEWDPTKQLEELRRNSLIDFSGLRLQDRKLPDRDMPGSAAALPETVEEESDFPPPATNIPSAANTVGTTTPAASAPSARPIFTTVDFATALPAGATENVLSPTEHGTRTF